VRIKIGQIALVRQANRTLYGVHLVDVRRKQAKPVISAEEAALAVKVSWAAEHSIRSDRPECI
jgi:hypothetical protein